MTNDNFAVYQPPYSRPYDPTNPFDRDMLEGVIIYHIRKCRNYQNTVWHMRGRGDMNAYDYRTRMQETERNLRQHEAALARLRSYGRI